MYKIFRLFVNFTHYTDKKEDIVIESLKERGVSALDKAIFRVLERRHESTFTELKTLGRVTPEIEEDYKRFLEKARQIFNVVGGKFTVDMVHAALPNNTWTTIYYEHRAQGPSLVNITHTTVQ